jgi:hypothetical protein
MRDDRLDASTDRHRLCGPRDIFHPQRRLTGESDACRFARDDRALAVAAIDTARR